MSVLLVSDSSPEIESTVDRELDLLPGSALIFAFFLAFFFSRAIFEASMSWPFSV